MGAGVVLLVSIELGLSLHGGLNEMFVVVCCHWQSQFSKFEVKYMFQNIIVP
jgi:hypothetical protein